MFRVKQLNRSWTLGGWNVDPVYVASERSGRSYDLLGQLSAASAIPKGTLIS